MLEQGSYVVQTTSILEEARGTRTAPRPVVAFATKECKVLWPEGCILPLTGRGLRSRRRGPGTLARRSPGRMAQGARADASADTSGRRAGRHAGAIRTVHKAVYLTSPWSHTCLLALRARVSAVVQGAVRGTTRQGRCAMHGHRVFSMRTRSTGHKTGPGQVGVLPSKRGKSDTNRHDCPCGLLSQEVAERMSDNKSLPSLRHKLTGNASPWVTGRSRSGQQARATPVAGSN
jgi:hypothetical protein